jgi:cytochrome c oxidase cbb3-type subunit 2
VVGNRSEKALKLGREWTIDPGYRWRPSEAQWVAILKDRGDSIKERFLSETSRASGGEIDLATPEGKRRLLDFWLTTEEEDHQVVPTNDADALIAYLLALRKAEFPLPEAKE